jgi:hypothetical protein
VSDTVTLIAGILLTSVGLLALLPFVLRIGRKNVGDANPLGEALLPALAATDAFMNPQIHFAASANYRNDGVNEEVEELMAHLFDLRMTVSELTAEVLDVQDALAAELPEDSAAASLEEGSDAEIREGAPGAGHAA